MRDACLRIFPILLITVVVFSMMETVAMTITAKLSLGGIRWIGVDNSTITVIAKLGGMERSEDVVLAHGETIHISFDFEWFTTPINLMVAIVTIENQIFVLEGSIRQNSIMITRAFYNEEFLAPNYGETLLEITFTGWFYTIELLLPIRGSISVECSINGLSVDAKIRDMPNGTVVKIENIILSEDSAFTIMVHQNNSLISSIKGLMSNDGLQSISIDGGIIEKLKARVIVTTGSQRAVVPSSILKSIQAEETLRVDKITELSITSTQIIWGNTPVRLLAFSRGSWIHPSSIISNALFEISLPRLNVTKLYSNNETAYLPTNERVFVKVMAEGYISQNVSLTITSEMKEIVFYLEKENPSLLSRLEKIVTSIVSHKFFVPAILGIIASTLIILIIRKR